MRPKIVCYFDGSCEPRNPGGNMGFGVVMKADGDVFHEWTNFVRAHPHNSNNVAEYSALEYCLNKLIEMGLTDHEIEIIGDSNLVIQQMSGKWKMKGGMYLQYALSCRGLLPKFSNLSFKWVPRHLNVEADNLSKANA
jgi:ribonuclease HI